MDGTSDDTDRLAVREVFERALADSGLTQEEFAKAMGTSGSRYSTYRRGLVMARATTMARAQRIAGALRDAREQEKSSLDSGSPT